MAFQTSEDVTEATHALRVCGQRAHRVGVLRIELDSGPRESDGIGDRAPPGARRRPRVVRVYRLRRARHIGAAVVEGEQGESREGNTVIFKGRIRVIKSRIRPFSLMGWVGGKARRLGGLGRSKMTGFVTSVRKVSVSDADPALAPHTVGFDEKKRRVAISRLANVTEVKKENDHGREDRWAPRCVNSPKGVIRASADRIQNMSWGFVTATVGENKRHKPFY